MIGNSGLSFYALEKSQQFVGFEQKLFSDPPAWSGSRGQGRPRRPSNDIFRAVLKLGSPPQCNQTLQERKLSFEDQIGEL
jgi:hypothetical protein